MADDKSQDPKGGASEGEPKKGEPKGGAITQERLDAEVARRHKAEQELEKINKAAEEHKTKSLEEQNKFKELYETSKTKAALADELEKTVSEYLTESVSDLSDEQKALIPEGPSHKQLAWVQKARKAGILGKQKDPTPGVFNGKPVNGLPADKWYLGLEVNDPKLGELTSSQYVEWKHHREKTRPKTLNVRGGF